MKSILKDASWVSAGQVINVGVALVTLKVWAVYLAPAELGLMALIVSAASILAGIAVDPLVRAMLVRYSAYAEAGKDKEFRAVGWAIISRVVSLTIISILLVGFAVCQLLDLHWSTPLLAVGLFVVDARRYFEQTLLAACRRQQLVAVISVGDVSFRLAFLWLFLETLGSSAYVAVAGNLLGALMFLCLILLMARSGDSPQINQIARDFKEKVRKDVVEIAWPIVPSNVLANVSEMSSRYVIAAMLGLHQAGTFVAVYGLVKRPFGMLSDIGFMAMLPAYSEALAKRHTDEAARIRFIWFFGILSLSIAGVVIFYLLDELIVATLLSKSYGAASEYCYAIGIAMTIYNVIAFINGILLAHGDSKSVLIGNVVAAMLTVVMLLLLIPAYGLHGAVFSIGAAYLLQFAILLAILLRLFGRQIDN